MYPIGSLAEAVGFFSGQLDMDPEAVDLDEFFACGGREGDVTNCWVAFEAGLGCGA